MLRGNCSSSTISARQSPGAFFKSGRFPAAASACSARNRRRTSSSKAGLFSNQRLSRSPLPNQKARIDAARGSFAPISCNNARVTNRLAKETSPYLQQHAANPVDWYPWGPEALERARREDKPILLSIGYAACHWCHVMAHESFEDDETARLMNDTFVNIKVDREERPDIDGIYMQAVQAMTGQGGWPMTMFLLPDGSPFYGGTYFPPDDRHGLPSFRKVLRSVSDAYADKREGVAQSADQLRQIYESNLAQARSSGRLTREMLEGVYRSLEQRYDAKNGGFGTAPKFPATMVLDFLLRHWKRAGTSEALQIVMNSFRKMAGAGIYTQIGGGFARYSVDASWLVPHFEKMLYDNALLTRLGAHLWQATKDAEIPPV